MLIKNKIVIKILRRATINVFPHKLKDEIITPGPKT